MFSVVTLRYVISLVWLCYSSLIVSAYTSAPTLPNILQPFAFLHEIMSLTGFLLSGLGYLIATVKLWNNSSQGIVWLIATIFISLIGIIAAPCFPATDTINYLFPLPFLAFFPTTDTLNDLFYLLVGTLLSLAISLKNFNTRSIDTLAFTKKICYGLFLAFIVATILPDCGLGIPSIPELKNFSEPEESLLCVALQYGELLLLFFAILCLFCRIRIVKWLLLALVPIHLLSNLLGSIYVTTTYSVVFSNLASILLGFILALLFSPAMENFSAKSTYKKLSPLVKKILNLEIKVKRSPQKNFLFTKLFAYVGYAYFGLILCLAIILILASSFMLLIMSSYGSTSGIIYSILQLVIEFSLIYTLASFFRRFDRLQGQKLSFHNNSKLFDTVNALKKN